MAACVSVVTLTLCIIIAYVITLVREYTIEQRLSELSARAAIIASFASGSPGFEEAELEQAVGRPDIAKDVRVLVIDRDVKAVYDSTGEWSGKIVLEQLPLAPRALDGEPVGRSFNQAEVLMLSVAAPVSHNRNIIGAVILQTGAQDITDYVSRIAKGMFVVAGIVCVLVGLLSFMISNILTTPLLELSDRIKSMTEKEFQQQVHVRGSTEVNQLVESFNKMVAEINAQESTRREFVSDASHELKTPLSSIKLICDSILSQNPPMEIVHDFLNDMNSEVERLTRIVNKLLTLTKMDDANSRHVHDFTTVNLSALCEEAVKAVAPLAEQKGVNLYFNAGADAFMLLDGDRIWEAVYNLLDNSIKYNTAGGEVRIQIERDSHNVYIRVADTGIGLEPEEMPRIFERFYRVDKARARDTGGTGLGLSIAQSAARLHGGEITVDSKSDMGSIFTIRLPLTKKTS